MCEHLTLMKIPLFAISYHMKLKPASKLFFFGETTWLTQTTTNHPEYNRQLPDPSFYTPADSAHFSGVHSPSSRKCRVASWCGALQRRRRARKRQNTILKVLEQTHPALETSAIKQHNARNNTRVSKLIPRGREEVAIAEQGASGACRLGHVLKN